MNRTFTGRPIEQHVRQVLRPQERLLDRFEEKSPSLRFQQATKRANIRSLTLITAICFLLYLLGVLYEMRP
jgi:hypothetical protein